MNTRQLITLSMAQLTQIKNALTNGNYPAMVWEQRGDRVAFGMNRGSVMVAEVADSVSAD